MKIEQAVWKASEAWNPGLLSDLGAAAQLVLLFGSTAAIGDDALMNRVRSLYPNAYLFGCSTAGEILATQVFDDTLAITACAFEHTTLRTAEVNLSDFADSFAAGKSLARAVSHEQLAHVLVLSDGLGVNGSELVKGIVQNLPPGVAVTGGLSADGSRFNKTLVCAGGASTSGKIAAIGFIGDRLRVSFGSMGGWDTFGPERIVTKSAGNVLYELDGQNALALYKRYLAEHAAGLPSTGLLFPLSIWNSDGGQPVVRTILAVNEADQSMTFAGDIPVGCHARLMRANMERLIDGAQGAARTCYESLNGSAAELGILISCVGRKLVLKQRIEEEIEAVADILPGTALTGFYSYGEISPFTPTARCELHNQTMTITTLREV
ncbi:MAG TPA: FIST N-terminal domain-containing protein [Tepidisphaeraceae bacterium]|jgi:hypothetical protein|nr:FIST N-terminal domain-containing protein [Tepidisphaeraceae bacterium]